MSSMVCQIAKACRSTVIRHRSDAKVCRPKGLGYLDPVSIFDKTSYRKISQNLEAVRFLFRIVRSLWNLTGTSAALSKRCDNLNYQSRGYETSRDLTIRRLSGYWNGALGSRLTPCGPGKHSCVKGNVDIILVDHNRKFWKIFCCKTMSLEAPSSSSIHSCGKQKSSFYDVMSDGVIGLLKIMDHTYLLSHINPHT